MLVVPESAVSCVRCVPAPPATPAPPGSGLESMVFSRSGSTGGDNLRNRARMDLEKPGDVGERITFAHRDHHRRIPGGAARGALKDGSQRATAAGARNLSAGPLPVGTESRDEVVIAENRVASEPQVVSIHVLHEVTKSG